MNSTTKACLLAAGGAALFGVAAALASRGSGGLGKAGLPPVVESTKNGGRSMKHYRKGKMTIKDRLGIMVDLTAKSVKDPKMRKLALQATSSCADRDDECEARAVYEWTKKNIRYTGDVAPHALWRGGPVESVDMFSSAGNTVENGGEDCDGQAVLNATLLILNGIPARFRATSPYKWGKDNYTHVYTMAGLPKNNPTKWVALDTTLPDGSLGEEVRFAKKFEVVA